MIKISHEISHAWFGIMIGSLDWTEAWISEGFATFLEDIIHDEVIEVLGEKKVSDHENLRAVVKYETLREEMENTSPDLQKLQPMRGQQLEGEDGAVYVQNGLNPVAGMTQAHYLKGYFLLHHLLELSGSKDKFFELIRVSHES